MYEAGYGVAPDLRRAAYWYRRAGRPVAEGDIARERKAIAEVLLDAAGRGRPV